MVLIVITGKWSFDGATIIYCPTKKKTEEVYSVLCNELNMGSAVAYYHAGLTPIQRKINHKKFANDDVQAVRRQRLFSSRLV